MASGNEMGEPASVNSGYAIDRVRNPVEHKSDHLFVKPLTCMMEFKDGYHFFFFKIYLSRVECAGTS